MIKLDKKYKDKPLFSKIGLNTLQTTGDYSVELDGLMIQKSQETLPLNSLVVGTDYRITIDTAGVLTVVSSQDCPIENAIAGFHYAPGGNPLDIDLGGNTTPQISEYSIWDLNYRPNCSLPDGMVKIGSSNVWCDIYLLNVDHNLYGTSSYNKMIATGSRPPIRAYDFGGYGNSKYGNNIMWNYAEVFAQYGKRLGTYFEHCNAAFGVREGKGRGSHPQKTGLSTDNVGLSHPDEFFTSKFGVIQASGCLWHITSDSCSWSGARRQGATDDIYNGWDAWNYTGGKDGLEMARGKMIMQSEATVTFLMHGGKYSYEAESGSRSIEPIERPYDTSPNFSARGFADHYRTF